MEIWVFWILSSALLLGVYDAFTKHAVRENVVFPVLFWATACGSAFYLVLSVTTGRFGGAFHCTWGEYGLVWVKSLIVGVSWATGYYALQTLPLSLVTPVRASSPFWVTIGGILLYHEIPAPIKALGMVLVFAGYYSFSMAGQKEGFSFRNSSGMRLILFSTIVNSASALWDKYILNVRQISPDTVQLFFSIDLVILFGIVWGIRRLWGKLPAWEWRWSIPLTGIFLILADFTYFRAVHYPGIQISQMALMRRSSCIVTFLLGVLVFRERNLLWKAVALCLILAGIVLLSI